MNEHRHRTYWANIYVGLQEGYDGSTHEMTELLQYCHAFCRKVDTTVSVTPTVFVYSKGSELGAIIGLIHAHSPCREEEISVGVRPEIGPVTNQNASACGFTHFLWRIKDLTSRQQQTRRTLLDWLRMEYAIEKPS